MGDSKAFSLESIRRSVNSATASPISRSTFWEKLSSKRLSKVLSATLNDTTQLLSYNCGINSELMQTLGATGLSFFDSTSVTLREKAKPFFDGTFTASAIKFHLESDGFSGAVRWTILSAASVHDNCVFPSIKHLAGRLSIFDLGYFDWSRFKEMTELGALFLSRLKLNSTVYVDEIVTGLGKKHIGKRLCDIKIRKSRGEIIEFFTLRKVGKESIRFRVVGFWNPSLKKYHWYVTNLECSAVMIAPLYRMRWQIELLIKGAKQSLNFNQIPSENEKIILNLCTAKLIALAISMVIRKIGCLNLSEEKRNSISLQRSTMVLANLSKDLVNFIIDAFGESKKLIKKRLKALLDDLYDPNYRSRKTSTQTLIDLVGEIT